MTEIKIKMQIADIHLFESKLKIAEKILTARGPIIMKKMAQRILTESFMEVPKDTGALSNSQFFEVNYNATTTVVEFGYGGSNIKINPKSHKSTEEYMIEVHENLGKEHIIGKAKFFEDPLMRNIRSFPKEMAAELRNAIITRLGGTG